MVNWRNLINEYGEYRRKEKKKLIGKKDRSRRKGRKTRILGSREEGGERE